jgi:hypothetical protein
MVVGGGDGGIEESWRGGRLLNPTDAANEEVENRCEDF